MSTPEMLGLLKQWSNHGWLRALDVAFARFLWQEAPAAHPLLILAAALASHQLGRGHACLDLAATLADPAFALSLPPEGMRTASFDLTEETPPPLPARVLSGIDLSTWLAALDCPLLVGNGTGDTPLVCTGSRLYLRRYWQYESDVRDAIQERLDRAIASPAPLPLAIARPALDRLFPKSAASEPDWQKVACALAARSFFSVITGGPGTGKTTTVVTLLALLQALAPDSSQTGGRGIRPLRIRLAAPTGKAAARLNASISGAVARLPLNSFHHGEAVRAAIPTTVTTLHRLLGSRPDTRQFRHHARNPLALDVLVVDEASMIDLEMMAALLAALPPAASLILLGDKDQLASVEAGAVLGQLCYRASEGHYTPDTAAWLKDVAGQTVPAKLVDEHGSSLDQAVVMLRHSHRFAADSGIAQLALAVNAGDTDAVASIWTQGYNDLAIVSPSAPCADAFTDLIVHGSANSLAHASLDEHAHLPRQGYRYYLDIVRLERPALDAPVAVFEAWAKRVLTAHSQFQVLCALRRGLWGVEGVNFHIAHALQKAGLIPTVEGWYLGRPVLVTRNDYDLGLMNGDIGITLALPSSDGRGWMQRVAFPSSQTDQGIKWVLPSRLQDVETVYALTVHKSQGSEFAHTVFILPETLSPILTRELLYTGITRARDAFTLVSTGSASVLKQAVQRRVMRVSGLVQQT